MIDHTLMEVCFEIQDMPEEERRKCHGLLDKMRQVEFSIGGQSYLGLICGIQTSGVSLGTVTKLTITSIHKL